MSALTARLERPSLRPHRADAAPSTGEVLHCYALSAEPEPSVLPRALEFIAKRGLLPHRCHATLEGRDGAELAIDLQVAGLDDMTADHVGECLRQIVGVNAVLMSRFTR